MTRNHDHPLLPELARLDALSFRLTIARTFFADRRLPWRVRGWAATEMLAASREMETLRDWIAFLAAE